MLGRLWLWNHYFGKSIVGKLPCPFHNGFHFFFFNHCYSNFDKVSDYRFNVSSHISNFSELCSFDFYKRSFDKLCQSSCNFRFTNTCGTNHYDVLRSHFISHFFRESLSSPSVSQSYCNCFFCFVLTNNVFVKLFNYFFWSKKFLLIFFHFFIFAISTKKFFKHASSFYP